MNIKQRRSFIVLLVITFIYTLFIWSNSFMVADVSNIESEGIRALINNFLKNIGVEFQLSNHITRKLAHFSEFALLGFLAIWTYTRVKECKLKNLILCSLMCLPISITDEIIQIFAPGRACRFTDVCIDFSGIISGIVFFMLLRYLVCFLKRKGEKKYGKSCSEK